MDSLKRTAFRLVLSGLGAIIYENKNFSVGHEDIMERFKLSKQQKFVFDNKKWKTYSRDGGDVVAIRLFCTKSSRPETLRTFTYFPSLPHISRAIIS